MMTRRHTTRTLAAALAVGLLAASVGSAPAHAQTAHSGQNRYQARIPGARVEFQGAFPDDAGQVDYSYNVTFPQAAASYEIRDGFRAHAAMLADNANGFRAGRKVFPNASGAHKDGVWAVVGFKEGFCHVMAGTYWRHLTFNVLAVDQGCAHARSAALAVFAAVSSTVGRHSLAGIPWPTRPADTRPAASTTPVPPPTATRAPAGVGDQEGLSARLARLYIDDDGEFPPAAGNHYVVAHVVLTNNSDHNQTYNTFDFKLEDTGHVQYSGFAMDSNVSDTQLGSGTLAPGETVAGDIAFSVPSDETSFWLLWTPDFMQPALYLH